MFVSLGPQRYILPGDIVKCLYHNAKRDCYFKKHMSIRIFTLSLPTIVFRMADICVCCLCLVAVVVSDILSYHMSLRSYFRVVMSTTISI